MSLGSSSSEAVGAPAISNDRQPGRTALRSWCMRAFALVELGDSEAIDLFLREEDAYWALAECLRDEPQWHGLLRVEEVELSADFVSPN